MSRQLSEEEHIRRAEALLAEIEQLHARIEHLEGVWDEMKKAGKKVYHGAAKTAKGVKEYTVDKVSRAGEYAKKKINKYVPDKDITNFAINNLLTSLHAEKISKEQTDSATRWTFELRGVRDHTKNKTCAITKQFDEEYASYNGKKYDNIAALLKALTKTTLTGEITDIAEMRGYTASILRQQAALLEDH